MTDADAEQEDPAGPDDDRYFPEGTFNEWIGLAVEQVGDGEAVLSVEAEARKENPGGILHGGVTATLVDVAAGVAIGSATEPDAEMRSTTNLDVHYLRPITDTAYATAEVVRVGSTNAVARVEVESTAPDGDRKTVAVGTVTYQRA